MRAITAGCRPARHDGAMSSRCTSEARTAVEEILHPRRQRHRALLVQVLLETCTGPDAQPDEATARIHSLCSDELAARVRIARDELVRAYRRSRLDSVAVTEAELRNEIDALLTNETSRLVDEERMLATVIRRAPRFFPVDQRRPAP